MTRSTRLLFSLCTCLLVMFETCHAYSFQNTSRGNNSPFTPLFLEQLGEDIDSNLMKLIATAFVDIENALTEKIQNAEISGIDEELVGTNQTVFERACDVFVCSEWAEWSPCMWTRGQHGFGSMYRNRTCGVNSTLCAYSVAESKVERQASLCLWNWRPEGAIRRCPGNFTLIPAGGEKFCLYYVTYTKSQQGATQNCQRLGANLVNVNTRAKQQAVNSLIGSSSVSIWINGMRNDRYSSWKYTYGGEPEFYDWASGEPSGSSNELCRVMEGSPRKQWDRDCPSTYGSVCEIVLV